MVKNKISNVGEAIFIQQLEFKFKDSNGVDKIEQGKYKLIYLGQDGKRFNIGFREFRENSIKAGFSENFIFQVPTNGNPTTISFEDKLFTVFKVSNKEIEFQCI